MQIQRLQNLYLLLAFLAAILSLNYPWVILPSANVTVQNNIPLLILALLATILPLLGICLFKNLKHQKLVSRLAALFAICSLAYAFILDYTNIEHGANLAILAPAIMFASALFVLFAAGAISSDQKLLKAADRIR